MIHPPRKPRARSIAGVHALIAVLFLFAGVLQLSTEPLHPREDQLKTARHFLQPSLGQFKSDTVKGRDPRSRGFLTDFALVGSLFLFLGASRSHATPILISHYHRQISPTPKARSPPALLALWKQKRMENFGCGLSAHLTDFYWEKKMEDWKKGVLIMVVISLVIFALKLLQ